MNGILEEMPETVYIADIDTHEILFINRMGRETFGVKGTEAGLKCYEVFQGRKEPCGFCSDAKPADSGFHVRKVKNVVTGCHYMLKDRLIEWNGKRCRMEIAIDVTENERQKEELENALKTESMITGCIKQLSVCNEISGAMNLILKQIGSFLNADRVYIFELHGALVSNTYEWCAEHVQPEIQHLQNMDGSFLDRWKPYFSRNECVVIEDTGQIRETDPELHELLSSQRIRSLIVAPLKQNENLIGMLGVDNPPADKIRNIAAPLSTLGYFIVSTMRRIKDKQLLEKLSYRDMLTDTLNRNAFIIDLETLSARRNERVGIVYLDVNGLKECNDKYGHKTGDRILIEIVENLHRAFRQEAVYRVGGDEFVVIAVDIEKEELERKVGHLNELISGKEEYSLSVGCRWSDSCEEIERLIAEADHMMYSNKKKYYREKRCLRSHVYGEQQDDESGKS